MNAIQASIESHLTFISDGEKRVLTTYLNKWIRCNGQEWVVERLKSVKQFYILLLSRPGVNPRSIPLPFFKKTSEGLPRGPFSFLGRLYRAQEFKKLILSLQTHTSIVYSNPTPKQISKFMKSVQEPKPETKEVVNWLLDFSGHMPVFKLPSDETSITPWEELPWSTTKRVFNPILKKMDVERSVDQLGWYKCELVHDIQDHLYTIPPQKGPSFDQSVALTNILYSCTKIPYYKHLRDFSLNFIGTISLLQEPGGKLRAIANPGRLFQVALNPLKDTLFEALKKIPEDFTYDQEAGVRVVLQRLREGVTCHSVDLSDATNTFPLRYTLGVLQKIEENYNNSDKAVEFVNRATGSSARKEQSGDVDSSMKHSFIKNPYLALFFRCSRSSWRLPDKSLLKWKKGQPLGLGPSFAAFALSHHHLVRSLWDLIQRKEKYWTEVKGNYNPQADLESAMARLLARINKSCPEGVVEAPKKAEEIRVTEYPYVLLGDDIVIFDDILYKMYRGALDSLGCVVSESKTLSSPHLAEFAGALVLSSGDAVRPGKFRKVTDENFLDYLRSVGPSGMKYLRRYQRVIAEVLTPLPEPVGLGWNPKGLSLSERIEPFLELFVTKLDFFNESSLFSESELLEYLMNNRGSFWGNNFPVVNKDLTWKLLASIRSYFESQSSFDSFLTRMALVASFSRGSSLDKNLTTILDHYFSDHADYEKIAAQVARWSRKSLSSRESLLKVWFRKLRLLANLPKQVR